MASGKVKWFNEIKGYGFIVTDDGQEVFAHYANIFGDGFKTLAENEQVEFEITETPKGLQATNIVKTT